MFPEHFYCFCCGKMLSGALGLEKIGGILGENWFWIKKEEVSLVLSFCV